MQRIKTLLSQLCSDLQETEFPNDVVQTETLRSDHRATRHEFEEDLQSTIHHGEALRDCLADVSGGEAESPSTAVKHRTELRLDRLEHVDAVDRSVGYFHLSQLVRMSVCLYVCISVSSSFCLSVHLIVCLAACLYVCISISSSVCLSVCLFISLSVCLSGCMSVCLIICSSSCQSVCTPVCVK